MTELLLSPTSLSYYSQCPRKFYLYKILRVPPLRPYYEANIEFGKLVHKAIQRYYEIIPSSLTPQEVSLYVVKACKDVSETLSNYLVRHMQNFIKFEKKRLAWDISPRPIAIEKEYVKPPFHGVVDAIFRKKDKIVVVDWKTGYNRNPTLSRPLIIQGLVYKYITGADEVFFVFLKYGDVKKLPDYDMNIIFDLADKIFKDNIFPPRYSPDCQYCEFHVYCECYRRGVTLWEI